MKPLEIVPATRADAAALVTFVNSGYRGDSSRLGWTTEANLLNDLRIDEAEMTGLLVQEDSVILKAIQENSLVGCVNLQHSGKALYMGMLTVSPQLQNAGIGKALLQAAEAFALQHSFTSIVMTVISVRDELIAWYQRRGYVLTGERRPFPVTDPQFVLSKQPLEFVVLRKELS